MAIMTRMTDGGGGTSVKTPTPVPTPTKDKTPTNAKTDTGTGLFSGAKAGSTQSPVKTPTPVPTPIPAATPTPIPVTTSNKPKTVMPVGEPVKQYTDTATGGAVTTQQPEVRIPTPQVTVIPKPVSEEAKEIADVEKVKAEQKPVAPLTTPAPTTQVQPTQGVTPLPTIKKDTTTPQTPTATQPTPQEIETQNIIQDLTNMLNEENKYMTELSEMTFDYNPATDADFLRDASFLENTVTQMMVGRGGMYSSVAQSALQSRLASLQLDYRQMKYDEFKEERAYKMDLAQMENNRRNTYFNQMMDLNDTVMKQEQWRVEQDQLKWENAWKQIQYENDLEDRALNKQWAIEDRNRAISDAASQKEMEIAAGQLSAQMDDARRRYAEFVYQKTAFDTAMAKWKQQGSADVEIQKVMKRLGVTIPITAYYSSYTSLINKAYENLNLLQQDVQGALYSLNMDAEYLDMINKVLYPAPIQIGETTTTITDEESGTTTRTTQPVYNNAGTSGRDMRVSPTIENSNIKPRTVIVRTTT